jgi:uncharacterized lipoprotein YddW (UPF0748 family)
MEVTADSHVPTQAPLSAGFPPMPRFILVILSVAIASTVSTIAHAEFSDYRSIFVDRFDYPYTGNITTMTNEINAMMQDAADEGFSEVIWQVRGRGDALYNSNIEPDVYGLTPGFDPLQTALDAAHSRGLKLHAWLNSTTMWNTNGINPPAGHIYHNSNPSFRLTDINGVVEPQDGWSNYSSVNPVLPEVHAHINNVVSDIATNYAVDGIHLDYIRYLPGNGFDRLPHDILSHQLFLQDEGLDGSDPANATAYRNYVKGRITDLVASVKQTVDAAEVSTGRTMEYSASVWRDPDVGENSYMQDYRTWLENDYLDVVMPMLYLSASNDYLFNPSLLNTLSISTNTRVVPTLASYLHTDPGGGGVALTLSQIERAYDFGADGINFYDFPSYFEDYSAGDRQSIKSLFDSIGDPPVGSPGNIIDDFEADEGHFHWPYNQSPASQTFGLSAATTIDRVMTEAQAGIASQELNLVDDGAGTWQLRHDSGLTVAAQPASNVPLDATGSIGFWLKTDDPGLSVQIALDDPISADRGIEKGIVADGQWHLYQWDLEDDNQWDGWAGSNGMIDGPTLTIDSIFFYGDGDATIYLDTVSHNPDGFLAAPVPGDFDGDGDVDSDDLTQWQGDFGLNPDSDADNDGDSDGMDFLAWQQNFSGASPLSAASAVPEPSTAVLLFMGFTLLNRGRVRKTA